MTRSNLAVILFVAVVVCLRPPAPVWAQATADFAGKWTLNRERSQFPREIGFTANFPSAPGAGRDSTAGDGGGQPGSGGAAARAFTKHPESVDDAKRLQQLTGEVREPSAHLTVEETPSAVTITDDRGQPRTFHPNGREEAIELDGVMVAVIATREAGQLSVLYEVEEGRQLRYRYSRVASPSQFVVDVQFVEHGKVGDKVTRVYEPATTAETRTTSGAPPSSAPTGQGAAAPAPAGFNQQPGGEFKGLTTLGVVVEELSSQSTSCGLIQSTIEGAVSKHLSDTGLKVRRNSDEDTYVYVNIMTATLSDGLCVSRYDAFLTSHTTATLSYQEKPVLVEVSLLHKGGIAGGAPAAHAAGVLRGVLEYVDQFATRIRDANK